MSQCQKCCKTLRSYLAEVVFSLLRKSSYHFDPAISVVDIWEFGMSMPLGTVLLFIQQGAVIFFKEN